MRAPNLTKEFEMFIIVGGTIYINQAGHVVWQQLHKFPPKMRAMENA